MLRIQNVKLYDDVRALPAWNYLHFQMYVRMMEVVAPLLVQNIVHQQDELITRLRYIAESANWREDIDTLITHIENTKVAYANSLEGVSHFYFAFACLLAQKLDPATGNWKAINLDLIDEESLLMASISIQPLSVWQLIEETRKVNDQLRVQLQGYFPELFPDHEGDVMAEIQDIKNRILSIDLDQDETGEYALKTIWEIHKTYLARFQTVPINPNDPKSFARQYIVQMAEYTEVLGLSEEKLKSISTHALFTKQIIQHRKAQKQKNENQ